MKMFIVALLLVMSGYWLFDHAAPLPFNHEQLGLYSHGIHRFMGVIFLVVAGIVWLKWHPKK